MCNEATINLNVREFFPTVLFDYYFYSKTNKMHQCIEFILLWNDNLHVSDSLSRPSSTVQDCTFSNRHLSNRYCCLLASNQTAVSV